MNTQNEIYKNVELKGFRTKEVVDIITEKFNEGISTKEIAKTLGIESYHPLVGILRMLNKGGYINKVNVIAPKKEPKNTFKNYNGSGKDVARDLIAEAIMKTKRRNSNILTLPADTWIMEKNILDKKFGYMFTAVERDKDTYKQMLKNMVFNSQLSDSVISVINKSIGEVVVNDVEDTYSSAILDYCGFIDSFYIEIDDILKRKLVRQGGYIAITLAENDRVLNNPQQLNNFTNEFIRNCYVDEEVNGAKVTNDLVNNIVFNNNGYKIVNKFKYCDKKAKMLLFIIKRLDD